jgi:hypothetical protein
LANRDEKKRREWMSPYSSKALEVPLRIIESVDGFILFLLTSQCSPDMKQKRVVVENAE